MVETQPTVRHDVDASLPSRTTSTGRFVVTTSAFDFAHFRRRRQLDLGPGHALESLAECLGADIVQPGDVTVRTIDRITARIIGTPEQWALARALVARSEPGDMVYAAGDDAGLPIGLIAGLRRLDMKLAIFYSAPARRRPRVLSKVVAKLGVDLLPVAGAIDKIESLDSLGLGRNAVLATEQTDTGFFHPAPARSETPTPMITSCGLEQRDYATMAAATEGLEVDVKICAASPNFTSSTVVAMPEVMPPNLEMRRFEFAELRELYRNAAVTVIPLLANHYSAGMTTMMEAIACGSPVIITTNPGLAADFAAKDLVIGVAPGDVEGLQRAVQGVLDDPEGARRRAKRALEHVLEHHSSARYVEKLCGDLTAFHGS